MKKNKLYFVSVFVLILFTSLALALITGCGKKAPNNDKTDAEIIEHNKYLEQSNKYTDVSINLKEIFHDQADIFMSPLEPTDKDNVTIRLRAYRGNITKASIEFTVDLAGINDRTAKWNSIPMLFERADETMQYDYFIAIIPAQKSPYKYHFKLENNKQTAYVNYYESLPAEKDPFNEALLVNPIDLSGDYYVMPNFSTPNWAKGTLWYSIMPDSFYNADVLSDKTTTSVFTQDAWGTTHGGGLSYFGGDLLGVMQNLQHYKDLNVESVFINPINMAYHNAGYGALDMTQIDSSLGNDNMLKELVNTLHANDMKLMLDGVFTYFASGSTYYNADRTFPFAGGANAGDKYYDVYVRGSDGNLAEMVWGSPRVNFSNKLARELVYSVPSSVMQWYVLEHGIDGWRLDVGSGLYGTESGQWSNATQIIQDMRRYLKDIDKDVLLCSEGGSGTMLTDYALDTMWNFDYYYQIESWLNRDITASTVDQLNRALYDTIMSLPRQVANCSYNFSANHDFPRTLVASKGDLYKVLGTTVMQMTFTGAPCIYFGEEIGLAGTAFFDTMIWDKSTWNYEIYNTYKALSQLRKDYRELYRDGAIIDLGIKESNEKSLLSFGRWKGKDKAITVMNPYADKAIGVEVNVSSLEIKNGATLYDYLSGRKYEVKDGKVVIDVLAGGAVLVNRKTNSWAGMYEIKQIGDSAAEIACMDKNSYKLSGAGSLNGVSDIVTYANLPIFNNYEICANVKKNQGCYAIMMRAGLDADSAFYALQLDASGLGKVIYRQAKGQNVQFKDAGIFESNDKIKIVRGDDNSFSVYRYINDQYVEKNDTKTYIEMKYSAYAGIAPISDVTTLENVSIKECVKQLATNFTTGTDSMMFTVGNAKITRNGKLTIGVSKDEFTAQLAQAPTRDFSIKAEISSVPVRKGDYNAITVYQSANSYIIAGRYKDDIGKLIIGRVLNGKLSILAQVDDISGNVTVQLEKVGVYFTARYLKEDGSFEIIGENLLANFSEMYAGVINLGVAAANFNYFTFGNAISDKTSLSAHAGYGYVDYSTTQNDYVRQQLKYNTSGGRWNTVLGGVGQTSLSAKKSFFGPGEAEFKGFRMDFTLQIKKAANELSNVAFVFGINDNGEYRVTLMSTGEVKLHKADRVFASYQIENYSAKKQYRFLVVASDTGKVSVYLGENPKLILYADDTLYTSGKIKIEGSKAQYEITSYNFFNYFANWWMSTSVNGTISTEGKYMVLNAHPTASGTILNGGVNDFIFSANVMGSKSYATNDALIGIIFDATAGLKPNQDGLLLSINNDKKLSLTDKGKTITEKQLDIDYESFYLIVVNQNNKLYIYIDKYVSGDENGKTTISTEPVLIIDIGRAVGGGMTVYASYTNVILSNLRIYGLKPNEDYKTLELFTDRTIESPLVKAAIKGDAFESQKANSFNFDFSQKIQLNEFVRYNGAWYVDPSEKKLVGLGKNNWQCGITLSYGTFTNYELDYKIDCKSSGAWAGVLINKQLSKDTHDDSGYLFYTNANGKGVYTTAPGSTSAGSGALDDDGYLNVNIKNYSGNIYVTVNGTTKTYANVQYTSGYISIVAGNCVATFKDINIYKLDGTGNRVR